MYTAPVPPVTMLSVRPVKFGVPVAAGVADDDARGALQATATSAATRTGARERVSERISTSAANARTLRRPRSAQPDRAPLLCRLQPPSLLVALSDERRERHRPAAIVGRDADQLGRRR